jgi:hypothetical protein
MFLKNTYDRMFRKTQPQPDNKTDLYDVLHNSYKSNDKASKNINGYELDEELSNDNHKVYYNPNETDNKKILISYRGTQNLDDIKTDAYVAVGKLRDTKRYDQSVDVLKKAKGKYGQSGATLTGSSLGGSIASATATDKDRVITYNQGNGLFGSNHNVKSKDNTHYRTKGDLVSFLGIHKSKTLNNDNLKPDFLNSHNLRNIKGKRIFF